MWLLFVFNEIFIIFKTNFPVGMNIDSDLFKINHRRIKLKRGRKLIAEPLLSDCVFRRSVILLVEYTSSGSMGLMLNKPSGIDLRQIVPSVGGVEESVPIFIGGPVGSNRLFYIHKLGHIIPDAVKLSDGLFINGNFDSIIAYIKSGNPVNENIRFFLGYSGWDGGQLDAEIEEGIWVVSPYKEVDLDACIAGEPYWNNAVREMGSEYKVWLSFPKVPWLN